MQLEPRQQHSAVDRSAVYKQPAVLRAKRHRGDLEHAGERPEPRLLFLLRSRIAKQAERARERSGDVLRGSHGEAQSIEYDP